jgi:hypothetical protein
MSARPKILLLPSSWHYIMLALSIMEGGGGGASSSVSDVDRYVIIRVVIRFCFQHASGTHTAVGNSSALTQDFLSVRLPAYMGVKLGL